MIGSFFNLFTYLFIYLLILLNTFVTSNLLQTYSWGFNYFGQLGDGTNTNRFYPVPILQGLNVIQINSASCYYEAIGVCHSLAIVNGSVFAWGNNGVGQLGDGTTTQRNSPVMVTGGLTNVTQVSAGTAFSHALLNNGSVYSWGENNFGQLGISSTIFQTSSPVMISRGLPNVIQIVSGCAHSLALLANGSIFSWGANNVGQLGVGTTIPQTNSPVMVTGGLSNVIQIASGCGHSLALLANGSIFVWGQNQYGQLGIGTVFQTNSPVMVTGGLSNVIQISGGAYHSLALLENGNVYSWGWNRYGQLGDGTNSNRTSPVLISGISDVIQLGGGAYHSLALLENGRIYSWGGNEYGELGDGASNNSNLPLMVFGLSNVIQIGTGGFSCFAIASSRFVQITTLTPIPYQNDSNLSGGMIGLVLGGLILVLCILTVLIFLIRKRIIEFVKPRNAQYQKNLELEDLFEN
jgi:alpha-tubulin suppressor-like RCC1 family protein